MLNIFMNVGILLIFLIFLRFLGVFTTGEKEEEKEQPPPAAAPFRKQLSYE